MDTVQIVKYSPEYHSEVRIIFSEANYELVNIAIIRGIKSLQVQVVLLSTFLFGFLIHSALAGVFLVLSIIGLQIYFIRTFYRNYVK